MEDSLTLDELLELYDAANERQSRLIKVVASAMGAEIIEDNTNNKSGMQAKDSPVVYDGYDLVGLPIGLGYEKRE